MEQTFSKDVDQSSGFASDEFYTFPLSFAQMDMWLAAQMGAGAAAYHIANNIALTGPLRVDVLAESLNEIVARHEILRTTFAVMEGEPLQMVAPERRYELPVSDLRPLTDEERENETVRLMKVH